MQDFAECADFASFLKGFWTVPYPTQGLPGILPGASGAHHSATQKDPASRAGSSESIGISLQFPAVHARGTVISRAGSAFGGYFPRRKRIRRESRAGSAQHRGQSANPAHPARIGTALPDFCSFLKIPRGKRMRNLIVLCLAAPRAFSGESRAGNAPLPRFPCGTVVCSVIKFRRFYKSMFKTL